MCSRCNDSYYPKSDKKILSTFNCYLNSIQMSVYWFESIDFQKCDSSCITCKGSLNTDCLTCRENTTYPIDTDKISLENAITNSLPKPNLRCYSNKPANYYWLDTSNKVLKKCSDNCDQCINSSDNTCITCSQDYYFKSDYITGGDKCYHKSYPPAPNFFLKEDLWKVCDLSCATCRDSGVQFCNTCKQDYYFRDGYSGPNTCYHRDSPPGSDYVLLNEKFYKCNDNCATCFSNTSDKCKTCADSYNFKVGYNDVDGDSCFISPVAILISNF